jgi:putative transposase
MPRKSRIDAPGALHHIVFRGIERGNIFRDNKDRDSFLDRLGGVLQETATACYAWALIPNHVHLLLKTGGTPISKVMQRVLTGHSTYFNRRHRRHGKLLQNRYKSILCQQDAYLLELVRYIHLNPVRSGVIKSFKALDTYKYTGHSALMANVTREWQNVSFVLGHFSKRLSQARRYYREFVEKGVGQGRRADLTGGGLIRSLGGWSALKMHRGCAERIKSDERILGDGDFVEEILQQAREHLEGRYGLAAAGLDIQAVANRVGEVLHVDPGMVWKKGKYPDIVKARSLAGQLRLTQPAVGLSVRRGEKLAEKLNLKLSEKRIL